MKKLIALILGITMLVGGFTATAQAGPKNQKSIVETALAVNADTGEFSTLIAALQSADLVDALNGKKQYTVFAPTNAAFAALGLNAVNIGSVPKDTLTDILLYHVTRGNRFSQSVVNASQLRMINGDFATINAGPAIENANIIMADIDTSNGVIHVIDTVLIP